MTLLLSLAVMLVLALLVLPFKLQVLLLLSLPYQARLQLAQLNHKVELDQGRRAVVYHLRTFEV
jgi:hypothetical protein